MRFLLVFLVLLLNGSVYSQDIQKVLTDMETYHRSNPQEKLYLHLDKYAYTAGETIWFKAYTTIGLQNLFSNHSGIAYVELIDGAKRTVSSMTIPLVMGLGMGDFKLQDTITEGSYRLRAYTNWMRNADEAYFYDRTIQITNGRTDNVMTKTSVRTEGKDNVYTIQLKSLSGLPLAKRQLRYEVLSGGETVERKRGNTDEEGNLLIALSKKYGDAYLKLRFDNLEKLPVNKLLRIVPPTLANSVQLFPEGGKLLGDRINNIAVKAINPKGMGIKAKVTFTIGKDTAGVIETNSLGMGAGYIFVQPDTPVAARAAFEDGSEVDVPMPSVYASGYAITVNNQNGSKVFAQLNVSKDLVSQKEVYFVLHHLSEVIFVSKQKLSKDELVFSVDKKMMPTGVLTISVLDERFQPIVERPFFNYNLNSMLPVVLHLNKERFTTRERVKVDLSVGSDSDSIRFGAFSASVIDLSKIKDSVSLAPNIISTLLLNSDLNGYIENPGYYFGSEGVRSRDLDLLMLTQGWRNIDWGELEGNRKPKYDVEKALKISGYTKKLGRTKPEIGAKVQLISTKNFMNFVDTTSNEEGYFEFNDLLFPDSVKFLVSARDANKGKNNIDIVIDKEERASVGDNRNRGDEIEDVNAMYIDQINQSKQFFAELERQGLMEKSIAIEEVVVRASAKKKVSEYSSNLNGPGNADQVLTSEELSTCSTLDMCLSGRLMGVSFVGGVPYNTRGNVPMQIVLDGMYLEGDQLSMININDVESVEVLRNANYTSIYGVNGGNGLLIITSKRGTSAMNNYVPKGIMTVQPQGLHVNREFYKPVYDVEDGNKLSRDLRTTIHWEPNIVADKSGKASFDFFTADGKGRYVIIVEGLDLSGRILRKLVEFEVD
ncbi:TonB-dependent receptor plug domain-containing protein [Sphingobacterium tabacisoli]|uniref:TonB-dependent receptor plug domain-containing protein n=1 Tax=Sphingobacterium tabacisoli TaxID=2044855 RepID=A0ABW5KY40_9SPHI|nr:TonB-dependent receptor plug domain-containing protein [Sphingobacterium tabacisoli]